MTKIQNISARLRPATTAVILTAVWVIANGTARAADDGDNRILIEGAGVAITAKAAQTELLALPPDARTRILSDASQMQQWLDTVYLRKALALEAEKNKLAQKSAVQYQLQSTRESILANAQLLEAEDAALPPLSTLDAQARAEYIADKDRFNRPEQTRARHILVKGTDDAAQGKAQQLLDQLKAGASFEDLARQNSGDPGSAARGGDLGWFSSGRMVPEFEAAVTKLQTPGELSPLVKSQFGFHIIRLEERRPAEQMAYETVKDQLIANLVQKARAKTREAEFKRVGDAAKGNSTALEAFLSQQRERNNVASPAPATPATAGAVPAPTTPPTK